MLGAGDTGGSVHVHCLQETHQVEKVDRKLRTNFHTEESSVRVKSQR